MGVQKLTFDHEVIQKGFSAANLKLIWCFRCSRTNYVRCAPQPSASSNLLGAKKRAFERLFLADVQKLTTDHEVIQEDYSAANLKLIWCFRCSRTNYVRCAPQPSASSNLLGAERRVFERLFHADVQNLTFDHEVIQEEYSSANLKLTWRFRCSRTNYVRCAPQPSASYNLLGAERRAFERLFHADVQKHLEHTFQDYPYSSETFKCCRQLLY